MDILKFREAIRNFSAENECINIVEENKEKLSDLQAEQWAQGRNADGELITLNGNGYAKSTIKQKRRYGVGLGAVTSRVTLFQTGKGYKSLFTSVDENRGLFSENTDLDYYQKLMERTNNAEGLDEESKRTFANDVFLPAFKLVLKRKTGIEF